MMQVVLINFIVSCIQKGWQACGQNDMRSGFNTAPSPGTASIDKQNKPFRFPPENWISVSEWGQRSLFVHQVFNALKCNALHIPFRNSRLTHLLQPCLSGDAKVNHLTLKSSFTSDQPLRSCWKCWNEWILFWQFSHLFFNLTSVSSGSSAVLRVCECESRHEERGGNTEHAAVRFHHTAGRARKSNAEHRAG